MVFSPSDVYQVKLLKMLQLSLELIGQWIHLKDVRKKISISRTKAVKDETVILGLKLSV